jgi:hypothetical protein
MQLPPELADEVAEVERRLTRLLQDANPDTIGGRAAAAFSDHEPAWRNSVFHSVDIQIAASDTGAVDAGEYLAAVGDVHPGNNPLVQGLFAHRHPDQQEFRRAVSADLGPTLPVLLPPYAPLLGGEARGFPATPGDAIHFAVVPDTRAQNGRRTWLPHELFVDGDDVVDGTGSLRVPVVDVFGMAIFVAGVRMFEFLPEAEHAPRIAIGRTVIRRESWSIPAADLPSRPEEITAFARERGMPRRVFAKSPLERKPMYVDTDSPVLSRILCRHIGHARTEAPRASFKFSEMLPTPDQCWLADPDGNRYVSELRFVAVDRTRLPSQPTE